MVSAQLALPVNPGRRTPFPTGVQLPCVGCAAAGIHSLGLPDRDGTPDALCMRCWLGRQQRDRAAGRRTVRELLWQGLGEAETAVDCAACGSDLPSESCWLCGYAWIAELQAQFDADQEEAAAAERAEMLERFERIAALTAAETEAARWEVLAERARSVVEAVPGSRRTRPVGMLAGLFARLGVPSGRGRPPAWPRVAGVMALAADDRSGRRARPGKADTATLADCSRRTVYAAWHLLEESGWCVRTVQGRLTTLEERRDFGLHRIRAQFDVALPHTGPAPTAEHERAALAVFVELLAAAVAEHERAAQLVDELRAQQDSAPDPVDLVRRARLRAAVARARADIDGLFSSPHPVGLQLGASPSALFLGSPVRDVENSPGRRGAPRLPAAGVRRASRSPGRRGGRSQPVTRPRTAVECPGRPSHRHAAYNDQDHCFGDVLAAQGLAAYNITVIMHRNIAMRDGISDLGVRYRSPRRGKRPTWATWALSLARELIDHWRWLSDAPRVAVAAVLGSRLGPDWSALDVVRWVERAGPVGVPRRPLAYLVALLDRAFTGLDEPPVAARLHDERRRQLVADERAEMHAAQTAWRAELDARDAAAAGPDAPGRAAARAVAWAAGGDCWRR